MKFKKYYIVADTREQFKNESQKSNHIYNDHPSKEPDIPLNSLEE